MKKCIQFVESDACYTAGPTDVSASSRALSAKTKRKT